MTVKRSSFNNCKGSEGGAISITRSLPVSLSDSNFINCNANHDGGAIYIVGGGSGSGSLIVTDCNFANNSVTGFSTGSWNGGGAIYSQVKSTISNSSFVHNLVSDATTHQNLYGGAALYMGGSAAGSTINNCIFDSNIGRSGGVALQAGSCTYSGCIMINNYATNTAGVISSTAVTVTIKDSIILNNTGGVTIANQKLFFGSGDGASFIIDYNWWGHNSTNKGSLTPVIPAKPMLSTLNRWLYMDLFHSSAIGKEYLRYYVGNWASTSASGSYADSDLLPDCDFVLDQNLDLGDFSNTNPIMRQGSTDTILYYPSGETGTVTIALKKDNVTYYSSSFEIE